MAPTAAPGMRSQPATALLGLGAAAHPALRVPGELQVLALRAVPIARQRPLLRIRLPGWRSPASAAGLGRHGCTVRPRTRTPSAGVVPCEDVVATARAQPVPRHHLLRRGPAWRQAPVAAAVATIAARSTTLLHLLHVLHLLHLHHLLVVVHPLIHARALPIIRMVQPVARVHGIHARVHAITTATSAAPALKLHIIAVAHPAITWTTKNLRRCA